MTDIAVSSEDSEFQLSLQGEDEIGVVIRAHIFIESKLNALLNLLLVSPKHMDKMNLDYFQRVQLAVSLGLIPQYESPLLALGTLRNNFAHKLNTKLSKDKVNSLYSTFSSEDKQLIQQSHDRTRKMLKAETKVESFSRISSKSQFILIAVTLRALLHIAVKEAGERRGGA